MRIEQPTSVIPADLLVTIEGSLNDQTDVKITARTHALTIDTVEEYDELFPGWDTVYRPRRRTTVTFEVYEDADGAMMWEFKDANASE